MRSRLVLMVVLVFATNLAVGCDSAPQSPTSPFSGAPSPTPTPAPTAPASSASLASLAIEDAFAIANVVNGRYVYEVRFLLRETGGKSGATVKETVVINPNVLPSGYSTYSQAQGESCWIEELRVPPGGMLDIFYTDAGSKWLSYCWVGVDAPPNVPNLRLEVHFKDDGGPRGLAVATISRFQYPEN